MRDEDWMRGWVHGHDRMSADIDRAVAWLGRRLRRLVDLFAPSHAPGEDANFRRGVRAHRKG